LSLQSSTDSTNSITFEEDVPALEEPETPRKQRRPGPDTPRHALPRDQWPEVVRRVEQGESLRHIAARFDVSHETVRRSYLKHQQQQKGGE
jgi:DNA-binding NarL/FixJ family response regulator